MPAQSSSLISRAIQLFKPPPPAAEEKKKPGTASGEVGSGWGATGGIPDLDYLDELEFPAYIEEFKRLENDPQIAKGIRETTAPLLNADWKVEPATDDPMDVLIAEFVGANLYQQDSDNYGPEFWCSVHWEDRLRDILRMLVHGFSVFQILYRQQGRFTVVDKLKYLMPDSILRFEPGDAPDVFSGVTRSYMGTDGQPVTEEFVSMDDLVFYTWDQEGSNILGKSLLRPLWMGYQFKQKFSKLHMLDKQKTAVGIPFFENPIDDSPENIARGEAIAKAMRGGNYERLYVRKTAGQDFGWKEGGVSSKGMPEAIQLMNDELAKPFGMGFTSLGQDAGSGGSRGVAGTQASFSSLLITAIAKLVIRYERQRILDVTVMNFAGRPSPLLRVSGIDPFEKSRILGNVVEAISAKVITNTVETENEVRRGYSLMEIDEAERKAAQAIEPASVTAGAASGQPGGGAADGGGDATGADSAATGGDAAPQPPTLGKDGEPVHLADAADPSDEAMRSARVDAGAIRRELERIESVYLGALRSVQSDMREAVVEQVRLGKIRPQKPADVKVPFQEELKERLLAIAKSARDFGREQVMAEVNRQLLTLARAVKPDPATRRGAITYSNQQAQVTAELDVSALVQRLQAQTTARYMELAGAGLEPEDIASGLETYLAGITDREIDRMARSSTSQVFNAGRNVAILELKPQLQPEAIRVEVADEDSCDPCSTPASAGGLNGLRTIIGSAEYLESQPPRGCKGGDKCRGFNVVTARVH